MAIELGKICEHKRLARKCVDCQYEELYTEHEALLAAHEELLTRYEELSAELDDRDD